jgi:hypothetical protein
MWADIAEATRLAQNLAGNRGYAVFPCHEDKRPATPHGFKDATTDPDLVPQLWRTHQGRLIGVATGAASGIDVLDLDPRHDSACSWWHSGAVHRLPDTFA